MTFHDKFAYHGKRIGIHQNAEGNQYNGKNFPFEIQRMHFAETDGGNRNPGHVHGVEPVEPFDVMVAQRSGQQDQKQEKSGAVKVVFEYFSHAYKSKTDGRLLKKKSLMRKAKAKMIYNTNESPRVGKER